MRLAATPATFEQRALAACLAVPGSSVAGPTAAAVHGMPVGGSPPIVVVVEPGRSPRTKGVTVVRSTVDLPSGGWYSARVSTPAATLLQLPRFADAATVERCLDHALAHRTTSVEAVLGLLRTVPAPAVPGRALLLSLLADRSAGIGHRSRLEQIVAGWLGDAGLHGWRRNHRVAVGAGRWIEVDFAWPDARVALEVSPFFTHGSRTTQERDIERRRLLVGEGWRIVEATDPDLVDRRSFASVAASLSALLARPGLGSSALGPAGRVTARNNRAAG
jgi:very-short-patch-repair endonuclease